MDTKDSVSNTNVKVTSSADRAAETAVNRTSTSTAVPNSNIVETDRAGGNDVRTVDMSGTNVPNATNAVSAGERARDAREVNNTTVDTSVPNPSQVKDANNAQDVNRKENEVRASARSLPTVKVRLTKPHTHEGIEYDEGDIVEVDEDSAKYITETADAGVKA